MSFCHLHVHSDGSLLDGLSKVKQIAKKAKECGQTAVALTDHGNIFNAIAFYKACQSEGVKPILGCEFYMDIDTQESKDLKIRDTYHLVLLAENDTGWRNIVKMVSLSNQPDQFYYRPRIDYKILEKHSDGVIALTACMQGIVAASLLANDKESAYVHAGRLNEIFGDSLYFETQNAHLDGQQELNEQIREMARHFGRKVVGTVDSHYLNREDAMTHLELMVIGIQNREYVMNSGFGLSSEFYLKEEKEVDLPQEELDNTIEVADRCMVTIDLKKQRFPKYRDDAEELLKEALRHGWKTRLTRKQQKDPRYIERAKKEINDIVNAGFADYFLIIADIVTHAKDSGYWVGPSRGSVAGSLLAFLLRITEVDPIRHNLIFERFYNAGRVGSAPDIDTDIELRYRQDVIKYIKEKFGDDRVSQLMTLNTMAARAALKDIMRFNNVPFDVANDITSLIPLKNDDHTAITLADALEKSEALREYSEETEYQQCFRYAQKIEGAAKAIGRHAAAVIISDTPFDDGELPLVRSPDGKDMVCGWDMKTIDSLNILKCDVLGLATLEVLHRCCDLIKEHRGVEYTIDDLYNFKFDDQNTYDLINIGWIDGVFQIESHLGKKWAKSLLPRTLDDISDLVSLIRPGPLDTGMTETYKKVRFNQQIPEYIHPALEPILESTNGVLCYQEQILQIANEIPQMSLGDADKLRKAMGKKLPEEMAKWKDTFVTETKKHTDLSEEDSESIWGWIESFAGYGFNRSHGIGYAIISYWTAYFKANYPIEFLCSCLICSQYSQKPLEEIRRFVNDAKLFDIKILPPDIRHKNVDFVISDEKTIRFGLSHIKKLGKRAIEQILEWKDVDYDNFYNFIFDCPLTKTSVVSLICSGALDCFGLPRDRMLREYELYKKISAKQQQIVKKLFTNDDCSVISIIRTLGDEAQVNLLKEQDIRPPNIRGRQKLRALVAEYEGAELLSSDNVLELEKEYLGISTTSRGIAARGSHTCLAIKQHSLSNIPVHLIVRVVDVNCFKTKKTDQEMAFIALDDGSYMIEGAVVFPQLYRDVSPLLTIDRVVEVWGKLDETGTLICDRITA